MNKLLVLVLVFSLWGASIVKAQKGDTTFRKNSIKLDLTSYWLYRNAVVFSYERVVKSKPFHTWSITAGYQQFPPIPAIDNISVVKDGKASGIKLGAEYRFYLQKENKYKAPRGVYIGPYTSYHNYSNSRYIEVDNDGVLEYADLNTDFSILNIGVQLGYQFVLNNRWTIDMVFIGPSVSNYSFKSSLEGNYTFNADDITNEVVLALIDRFPAFETLINENEFASKGKLSRWGYGYRYQLQVGYHFGRKKK